MEVGEQLHLAGPDVDDQRAHSQHDVARRLPRQCTDWRAVILEGAVCGVELLDGALLILMVRGDQGCLTGVVEEVAVGA